MSIDLGNAPVGTPPTGGEKTQMRSSLGLGTLATQNGTFSGTSSGTNTGDETTATIKSKLSITTLSGSNTGDQDLSSYLTSATATSTYQPLDTQLTSLASLSYTGNTLKVVRVNSGETGFELASISVGGGDALYANNLNGFADVTQTSGQTLSITTSTTLAGGTHSGTNTGDNAVNSLYSGLATSKANLASPDFTGTATFGTIGSADEIYAGLIEATSINANIFSGAINNAMFTGPTVLRTYTLPDIDCDLLRSGGPLGTPSSGTVSGSFVTGGTFGAVNGSALTALNGSAITTGTVAAARVATLNQNTTGSAATLTTPRAINGTNFDGSAAITVTAAAGTLTGATLAAGVTASSLTSVGTISTGVWQGTIVGPTYLGTGSSISTKYLRGDGTWQTIAGGGDALTSGHLGQFASTTSLQLLNVISNETGTGSLVFATSPTLVTPLLGTPTSGVLTSCTGYTTANLSGTITNAQLAGSIAASKLTGTDIATVGTIGTGTWQGTLIAGQYGGTGVNNSGKTITLGGNFTTSGAFATTLTATATTAVTLPTTGTLSTLAGAETLTNKTITSPVYTEAVISASAIDWAVATNFTKTLSANTTFTFSNLVTGKSINVAVTNTASNYTVTWPTVSWAGGTAPTQTVGAKTDIYTFIRINGVVYGSVVQNF